MEQSSSEPRARSAGVGVLAWTLGLFGLLALVGSLFLWGQGFLLRFPPGIDYAFPVADILVNAPASLAAAVGLWRMRRWGYVAAQFVAGFYVYASVEIFAMVWQEGPPFPLAIVVPQVAALIVAGFLVVYLWPRQAWFN
jgi:hypothetical protein